jgi:hypothetical protein
MKRQVPGIGLLPSPAALIDAPQLSSLALLELALVVVPRDLDLHDNNIGSLSDLLDDPPPNIVASLFAQLVSDRCRELSTLTAAYRAALERPPWQPSLRTQATDDF